MQFIEQVKVVLKDWDCEHEGNLWAWWNSYGRYLSVTYMAGNSYLVRLYLDVTKPFSDMFNSDLGDEECLRRIREFIKP